MIRRYDALADDEIRALDFDALAMEYRALREHHAKETRILLDACERVCDETDWCPICEAHPSSGHAARCLLSLRG